MMNGQEELIISEISIPISILLLVICIAVAMYLIFMVCLSISFYETYRRSKKKKENEKEKTEQHKEEISKLRDNIELLKITIVNSIEINEGECYHSEIIQEEHRQDTNKINNE